MKRTQWSGKVMFLFILLKKTSSQKKKKKKDLNFSRKDNYKSKGKLDFIIQHWPTAPEKQPWKADTL